MKNLLKYTAIVFTIFLVNTANAQKFLLGAGGGYATFSMSDTKDYNHSIQQNLPFTPVLTDDFPGWLFFNAEALYSFPKVLAAGLKISTTSTGSRLHLADYSGEYTFDNQQKGWFPGVRLLLGKAPGRQSGPCFSLEGGMAFSSMNFDEKIELFDEHTNDHAEFRACGFYAQPGLSYLQHVGEHIILSANVSYYLDFESGYFVRGHSDQKIRNNDTGEKIKPDWNGLRAGFVVYWSF